MPRGSSPKREREYEELVGEFEKEGRYGGREEEVAARIVNKQRAERGETKSARRSSGGQASRRKSSSSRGGKKSSRSRSAAKSSRSRSSTSKRGSGKNSRRSQSGSRRARSSSSGRTARVSQRSGSSADMTRSHEFIRKWVEARGGHPATVRSTADGEPGILRIDYPGYSGRKTLERISWADFFKKFDEENLAFLHQDKRNSRFSKLVRASRGSRDRHEQSV